MNIKKMLVGVFRFVFCPDVALVRQSELMHLREVADSIVRLKQMTVQEGGIEMVIEQSPELAEYVAKCMALLVAKSPNYTEMTLRPSRKYLDGDKYDYITVLIQKVNGKTPHQLREEAERVVSCQAERIRELVSENVSLRRELETSRHFARGGSV